MIELLFLSELQGIGLVAEVSAGIHHVPIKPQRIELVGDVVVVGNGVAIALAVVAPEAPQSFAPAGRGAPGEAFGHPEHLQDRPFDAQVAFHVGLAELHQVGDRRKRSAEGLGTPILTLARWRIEGAAIPQLEAQRDGCRRLSFAISLSRRCSRNMWFHRSGEYHSIAGRKASYTIEQRGQTPQEDGMSRFTVLAFAALFRSLRGRNTRRGRSS